MYSNTHPFVSMQVKMAENSRIGIAIALKRKKREAKRHQIILWVK